MNPALVVLAGLPGTGKTTIARALARASGAIHLRIDTIETALRTRGVSFAGAAGDTGYVAVYALAHDLLRQEHGPRTEGLDRERGNPPGKPNQDSLESAFPM